MSPQADPVHYLVPTDLDDALRLRRETGYPVIAGGTDLYPAIEDGLVVPGLIDVSKLAALAGPIRRAGSDWVIPALATWTQVVETPLPPMFDLLKQAAADVGGRQIQNTGTVGGNLCNASPAADGIAALLALDATVALAGTSGRRVLPLAEFVLGNRRTALAADEILLAVRVPAASFWSASRFRKLGSRRYLVISVVMTGVVIEVDDARVVRRAAVVVGACAPRALRIEALERRLVGSPVAALDDARVDPDDLAALSPIDDVRGSSAYRRHAARALVEESLRELAARHRGERGH